MTPDAANSKEARGFVRYLPHWTGHLIGVEIQAIGR